MITPRFVRLPDRPGLREYDVQVGGQSIGTVSNRRGGWWRAYAPDGKTCGSWHSSRKDAAAALYEYTQRRISVGIEERLARVDFGAELAAEGVTTVALDADGNLVEYRPDAEGEAVIIQHLCATCQQPVIYRDGRYVHVTRLQGIADDHPVVKISAHRVG